MHEDAMWQMVDIMGVNGVDIEEVLEETRDCEEPIFSGPGPEEIIGLYKLCIHVPSAEPGVVGSTTTEPATAGSLPTAIPLAELAPKTPDPVIMFVAYAEAPASLTAEQAENTLTVLALPPMPSVVVQPANQTEQTSPTAEMKEVLVAQK